MTWILTRFGKRFDLAAPHPDMVDIIDISHSLAMQCRFNGHTREFYSVAQHCLLVASLVPAEHQLVALLHDATEAYVGDLVSPLKQGMRSFYEAHQLESLYEVIEQRVWLAICAHFNIEPELPECVKHADLVALATEKRDLLPYHQDPWPCLEGITPADQHIITCHRPKHAELLYHTQLLLLLGSNHWPKQSRPIITQLPIDRDQNGWWTHPAFANFSEETPPAEFQQWKKDNALELLFHEMVDEVDTASDPYFEEGIPSFAHWNPASPEGEGWFILSIHETENGPVCVWARPTQLSSNEVAA